MRSSRRQPRWTHSRLCGRWQSRGSSKTACRNEEAVRAGVCPTKKHSAGSSRFGRKRRSHDLAAKSCRYSRCQDCGYQGGPEVRPAALTTKISKTPTTDELPTIIHLRYRSASAGVNRRTVRAKSLVRAFVKHLLCAYIAPITSTLTKRHSRFYLGARSLGEEAKERRKLTLSRFHNNHGENAPVRIADYTDK